jgi:hypothetical protein
MLRRETSSFSNSTSSFLKIIFDPDITYYPFGDPFFLSSIDSPCSLSFRLSATSQLYTRAKATSKVYKSVSHNVQLCTSFFSHTVICSLKKSISSSQLLKLVFAVESFVVNSSSASGIGYASMTFAPSHRNTSSVGGISAFAYRVSLSSKVVSMGSASGYPCIS